MAWFDAMFSELETMGDEAQSEKMSAYMQNQFPFLGVPKPRLKEYIKPWLQARKKLPIDWEFVDACWNKPYREAQYIAVEYLIAHKKDLAAADFDRLKELIVNKSWWETVDSLDVLVGILVQMEPAYKQTMLDWSTSDNIWLRRVAIDYQQEYKEATDEKMLEQIICNNLGSDEFFINEAIGWSLRDYSKTKPTWVKAFIEKYRDRMATLSVKEAGKYI